MGESPARRPVAGATQPDEAEACSQKGQINHALAMVDPKEPTRTSERLAISKERLHSNCSPSTWSYGPEAWSGSTKWWGASATSVSIAGGLITLEDLDRSNIFW
jgi:hypothetical protein